MESAKVKALQNSALDKNVFTIFTYNLLNLVRHYCALTSFKKFHIDPKLTQFLSKSSDPLKNSKFIRTLTYSFCELLKSNYSHYFLIFTSSKSLIQILAKLCWSMKNFTYLIFWNLSCFALKVFRQLYITLQIYDISLS